MKLSCSASLICVYSFPVPAGLVWVIEAFARGRHNDRRLRNGAGAGNEH